MSTRIGNAQGEITRILITGANGFIGSNLCRYFLDLSWEVVALVRRSSSLHFLQGMPVTLVYGDLAREEEIELPPHIDFVIHAASLVVDSMSHAEARRNIHDTTRGLLRLLARCGVRPKRFVYISTVLVLGHRRRAISDGNPGRPARGIMPYARAKAMTEALLRDEQVTHGLPVVILRPSDVYGPNDRTSSLRVLRAIEAGWPALAGSGRHILSFCWVGNLALACHLACQMRGTDGAAYTVTNGQDITWRELMGFFQRRLGRPQKMFLPLGIAYAVALVMQGLHALVPAFPMLVAFYPVSKVGRDTSYDISRTEAELGYRPAQDIEHQLEEIVQWYLREKSAGVLDGLQRRVPA